MRASPPRRGCSRSGSTARATPSSSPTSPATPPSAGSCAQILLSPETGALDHRAEALLYAADKAEHVEKLIRPALAQGKVVITDRYVDSTLAYQGAGRDLLPLEVERLARWATADLRPHLTVLLDVEPELGLGRFETADRIEAESVGFHQRVRDSFLELAPADPEHYVVVDARMPRDEIAAIVRDRITPVLPLADRRHDIDEPVEEGVDA